MPTIRLPTFHIGQVGAFRLRNPDGSRPQRKAVRCGRRWGKTEFGAAVAADGAAKRELIGWFAPEHRFVTPAYHAVMDILAPIRRSSSIMRGSIETTRGGSVEFWSLDNELAGRSRKYHKVIVDEGAFTKAQMKDVWEKNIEPTLVDFDGDCLVLSNTNGDSPDNFMWQVCHDPKLRFVQYHAPSWQNPHIPGRHRGENDLDYLVRKDKYWAAVRARTHPLVFRQEYEAEFVDFSGVAFFARENLLVDDKPVAYPEWCEQVGFVLDTAVKGGREHDGTAIIWYAYTDPARQPRHPLIVLDWDIVQIDGALLENQLPIWLRRGEELAKECHALHGFTGGWIEDASAGSILLQQAHTRGWPVEPLPSVLTAAGKDARAINASGPVYRNEVKVSAHAFHKTKQFKDAEANHFWRQVTGFRIGDKSAATRADDLLDDFTYMVAVTLGDSEGIA